MRIEVSVVKADEDDVVVEVKIPEDVSPAEKELWKQLRESKRKRGR